MALKEGSVRWRMTRAARDVALDARKVELLEEYHGQPTMQFSADEQFAGREARRGARAAATPFAGVVTDMSSMRRLFLTHN
eukprot:COSAG01_NODE_16_length_40091_cov_15.728646_6_plen_81_part_00